MRLQKKKPAERRGPCPGLSKVLLTLSLALLPFSAAAEIVVVITPPHLKPGWGTTEFYLSNQVSQFSTQIADAIQALAHKPQTGQAFILANSLSGAVASRLSLSPGQKLSFSTGVQASVQADPLAPAIIDTVRNLKKDGDVVLGLGAQGINLAVAGSLGFFVPGLELGGSLSYWQDQNAFDDLFLFHWGGQVGWRFVESVRVSSAFSWHGLRAELGFNHGENRVGALVSFGTQQQAFQVDPDGSGPLAPLDVNLELQPKVNIHIETEWNQGVFQLGSGIGLLGCISLDVGAGLVVGQGQSRVRLSSDADIQVLGYLSNQIEAGGNPRLSIRGTAPDTVLVYFYPYLFAELGFTVGQLFISVPFSYGFSNLVSIGVNAGISL